MSRITGQSVQYDTRESNAVQSSVPEEFAQPSDRPVLGLVAQGHNQAESGLPNEVQVEAALFQSVHGRLSELY